MKPLCQKGTFTVEYLFYTSLQAKGGACIRTAILHPEQKLQLKYIFLHNTSASLNFSANKKFPIKNKKGQWLLYMCIKIYMA